MGRETGSCPFGSCRKLRASGWLGPVLAPPLASCLILALSLNLSFLLWKVGMILLTLPTTEGAMRVK